MQGIKNLTQGPINRQLFNLAMPIMATSFIQMAYSLTDMAWVGRLGSEAVAAIGSVGILTWMSGSISLLNKVGSEVSVGQSIGAQSQEDARSFASHNITIALIISICWGGLLFIFAEPIIRIYELEEHITANAIQYLRIVSTGLPFVFLSAAFTGIYNAAGRSKVPFFISGTGLILNIVLDPLFIFGFGLGTNGAAYATWIAEASVFLIFVYQLRCRDALLGGFPFFTRLKKKYTRRILKLGLPSALSAFIAQNYAAGRIERVLKSWYTTLWMTGIFGTLCTLLFVFFGNEVFAIFVPEQAAYEAGGVFLRIDGYSQLFMMLEITMQGVFYGIGRTIPPAIISISCNYMRIPLAILFVRMGMGVEGIWWAVCVTTVAKGLILLSWFIIIKKKCLSIPSTIK